MTERFLFTIAAIKDVKIMRAIEREASGENLGQSQDLENHLRSIEGFGVLALTKKKKKVAGYLLGQHVHESETTFIIQANERKKCWARGAKEELILRTQRQALREGTQVVTVSEDNNLDDHLMLKHLGFEAVSINNELNCCHYLFVYPKHEDQEFQWSPKAKRYFEIV